MGVASREDHGEACCRGVSAVIVDAFVNYAGEAKSCIMWVPNDCLSVHTEDLADVGASG